MSTVHWLTWKPLVLTTAVVVVVTSKQILQMMEGLEPHDLGLVERDFQALRHPLCLPVLESESEQGFEMTVFIRPRVGASRFTTTPTVSDPSRRGGKIFRLSALLPPLDVNNIALTALLSLDGGGRAATYWILCSRVTVRCGYS